ncbi:MAG: PrsW family intramembrane metalloprotease [Saprospiraceae bacterium]
MKIPVVDPLLILLAALPGLLICWYIYRTDKYEHESQWQVLLAFTLGAAATYPIIQLEEWISTHYVRSSYQIGNLLLFSFLAVALLEEIIKFTVLLLFFYPRRFFNEPLDGIVYSVIVAMGFATAENMLYAMEYGLGTTILRAFTAVPAHAVFAVLIGYYVGKAKFKKAVQNRLLIKGLIFAVLAHGLYDVLIFQRIYEGLLILVIAFIWVAIYFERELIKKQREESPFKESQE